MIKCLIVDDEKPAREELEYLLKDFSDISIVGMASHGLEAIKLYRELNPDLIFLDVQMPQINGIEVAEQLITEDKKPLIIFVTAYDNYAIKAFELNAIDYLLKPVSEERLKNALDKVRKTMSNFLDYEDRLRRLLFEISPKDSCNMIRKICLYKNGTLIPINTDEIIYATVENRSTVIISKKGRYEYPNTLSHLEEKLNTANFFRSHRSFLINLNYIEQIEPWFNSTYMIKLRYTDEKIPVSRNQVKRFKEIMNIT